MHAPASNRMCRECRGTSTNLQHIKMNCQTRQNGPTNGQNEMSCCHSQPRHNMYARPHPFPTGPCALACPCVAIAITSSATSTRWRAACPCALAPNQHQHPFPNVPMCSHLPLCHRRPLSHEHEATYPCTPSCCPSPCLCFPWPSMSHSPPPPDASATRATRHKRAPIAHSMCHLRPPRLPVPSIGLLLFVSTFPPAVDEPNGKSFDAPLATPPVSIRRWRYIEDEVATTTATIM